MLMHPPPHSSYLPGVPPIALREPGLAESAWQTNGLGAAAHSGAPAHTAPLSLDSGCTFSQASRVPFRVSELLLQLWTNLRNLPLHVLLEGL